METNMEWIDINEKKPKEDQYCLTYYPSKHMQTMEIQLYSKGTFYASRDGWVSDEKNITHWMPLPEPPTK